MQSPNQVLIPVTIAQRSAAEDPHAAFVSQYLADDKRKVSVVAEPGMGKTTVACIAAARLKGDAIREQLLKLAVRVRVR